MRKFGFSKKSGDGDDDSNNRLALFGSRSKSKSPAPSSNPYAQPTAPLDAYSQAKVQAGVAPPPAGTGAPSGPKPSHGGMNGDGFKSQQGNPYGEKNYNSEPKSGYAPDRYGNQGGYGGDRYGSGGQSGSGSRYGPGGYGGLGNTDPNDPAAADRDALFGGAKDRVKEQPQNNGPPPPYSQGGGAPGQAPITDAAGLDTSYGAYQDRQLTAEEEEEEDVQATKQDIRFMKQQDVSSTRNALRVAAQAEESGRGTLARLGAQGERIHNTEKHLDLASNQNRIAQEKARELKTVNGSMFAVHVANPFTASSRRKQREDDIINRHQDEREEREETRQAAFRAGQRLDKNFKEVNSKGAPGKNKASTLAERSKYQFEQDSEDDEMENEIESNLDALNGAAGRLNALAKATGQEIGDQNKQLDVIAGKVRISFLSILFANYDASSRILHACANIFPFRATAWTIKST